MEKSAVTVSDTVVECVALGAVPVMVMVELPVGVLDPTLTVMVDDPPAVTEVGLKLAVAPEGSPLVLKAIDSAEPLVTAVVMVVELLLAPWGILRLVGLALMEKSFAAGAVTFTVTVVL